MESIDALMQEHRQIERAIDALLAFAAAAAQPAEGEREELGRFVTFISRYADARHHHKEEEVLFPAMVEAGFSLGSGPLAVMLYDHAAGRRHVAALRALSAQESAWTPAERGLLAAEASGYAFLLQGHIQKEDGVLYRMALQRLSPALQQRVDAQCREADAQWAEETAGLEALLEGLVARAARPDRQQTLAVPVARACCG